MVFENVTMRNPQGLHLRPAMTFANRMSRYDSHIRLEVGERVADGKSLVSLISAGIGSESQVKIICDGPDEEEMLCRAAPGKIRGTVKGCAMGAFGCVTCGKVKTVSNPAVDKNFGKPY